MKQTITATLRRTLHGDPDDLDVVVRVVFEATYSGGLRSEEHFGIPSRVRDTEVDVQLVSLEVLEPANVQVPAFVLVALEEAIIDSGDLEDIALDELT